MTQSATPGIPWRSYSRPGFQSCKTTRPVFYSGRWPRDALVQATLDPSIRLITPAYLPEAPEDAELALDVTRGATRELHAYCRNSHGPLSAPEGYDCAVAIPRFKVMQPSVLLVARMIWKMRSYPVDAETALTIRRLLLANGGNMTLLDLAESTRADKRHFTSSALSLVCHGHLELSGIKVLISAEK